MFKNSITLARKFGRNAAAGALSLVGTGMAMAQTDTPIEQLFGAIDVTTVAAAVLALLLAAIGIAMAFKGGKLAKKGVNAI